MTGTSPLASSKALLKVCDFIVCVTGDSMRDADIHDGGAGTEARRGHDGERAPGVGCPKMADTAGR